MLAGAPEKERAEIKVMRIIVYASTGVVSVSNWKGHES